MEKTLIVEEIAEILRISPATMRSKEWQTRTKCPLRKVGKRLYALETDIRDWFKNRG